MRVEREEHLLSDARRLVTVRAALVADRERRAARARNLRCRWVAAVDVVALPACSVSDAAPSLAERLERRYDGDVACIQAILQDVDSATASALNDIADNGTDPQVWLDEPAPATLARIIAC